jgi:hypothetical protein
MEINNLFIKMECILYYKIIPCKYIIYEMITTTNKNWSGKRRTHQSKTPLVEFGAWMREEVQGTWRRVSKLLSISQ